MPHHYSHKELRILCQSSVVGSQFLHAVGKGLAIKNLGLDEVVYVSAGDGATSQGDFHEALNFSAIHKLPVIFVIQNNGWAISVPLRNKQLEKALQMSRVAMKGWQFTKSMGLIFLKFNMQWTRRSLKGALAARSFRFYCPCPSLSRSHSNSDDPKKYRTSDSEELDEARDPITRFEEWLKKELLAEDAEISRLKLEAKEEVEAAALAAEAIPFPEQGSSRFHVFAPFEPPGHSRASPKQAKKLSLWMP